MILKNKKQVGDSFRLQLDLFTSMSGCQHTLLDAFLKYTNEVSPKHRGHRWEILRLSKMSREMDFVYLSITDIECKHLSDWRDRRLREVKPGTVRREMIILHSLV